MSADIPISFDTLPLDDAIDRIIRTLQASKGSPPFTLLLGAGFSFPVIPTASQMVEMIPSWLQGKFGNPNESLYEFSKNF